jgi:hypothetical protein
MALASVLPERSPLDAEQKPDRKGRASKSARRAIAAGGDLPTCSAGTGEVAEREKPKRG